MKIRGEISKVLGLPIPPDRWEAVFTSLATQGKITQRVMQDMLVVICKKLEEIEKEPTS